MNRGIAISFLIASMLGAVIWGLSPLITNLVEPWDAETPYYVSSLFAAGVIVGLAYPRHIMSAFLGIVVGQLVYMLVFIPLGPLSPLGILFLFGYGLISLLGAALGAQVQRMLGGYSAGGKGGT